MKYRYFIFFTFIFLFAVCDNIFAQQKPVQNSALEIIQNESEPFSVLGNARVNLNNGVPIALYNVNYLVESDTPEKMARQYLSENSKNLHLANLSDLRYLKTIETPGGYHVHFAQYIGEYPVYNSTINVTISKSNRVVFVMNGYKEGYGTKLQPDLVRIHVSQQEADEMARNYLGITGSLNFEKIETIVYYNKGQFWLAQKVNLVPAEELYGDWEVLVDAQSGEIFRVEDKAFYFRGRGDNPELVNGSGWVFDPDPITHARTTYGTTGFIDNNDADSDSLTAHIEERTLLDITFDGSNYLLKGPWAEIRDFEGPNTGLHTSPTTDFHYTRSNDSFEAANTYYHIDHSMRHINETLGFTLTPYQYTGGVRFDPHGLNGADNSHYLSSTGSVAFGDGGVDDAEDLSVIIHELGHGIHDWITNGGLSQVDGLSEGCGDYWAVSQIRSSGYWTPGDPAYNWVFIWDGHNPFWPGRITNYTAHYPEGLTGVIHTDGQMWSSSLMSIYDLIGRSATDSDFLEGLSMTNGGSSQQDAAMAFMQADQLLYGGANLSSIIPVFTARGYIEGPITADFMADVTGGPAPLTVHFTDLSTSAPDPIISWDWDFDFDGTIDSHEQNPSWTYTDAGSYTVSLTVSDGTNVMTETKYDYITVNSGVFVWEGEGNGANYSGTFIKDYLTSLGYTVVYSSAADLPSNLAGYDAVFLSFGNYGSGGSTYTEFTDAMATTVIDYLQNGGNVYLEGGDAFGFNQSSNTTLLNLFGLASAADGASGNTPVTNLQGQTGTLTEGMLFTSSTQPNNTWIDIYTPNGNGTVSFIESTVGNVGVQGSGSNSQKTMCFSYALAKLTDATFPSTRENLIDKILEFFDVVVPVELISFNATVDNDVVNLSWETATELNNQGFEVQKRYEHTGYISVGFVEGHGTTTEKQNYSFQERNLQEGKIFYRLRQIDFDGTFDYSNEIEVVVNLPVEFKLQQNYPNPFNPSTKIAFSIPSDSKVVISLYNIIGQKVMDITNKEYQTGRHEIVFNGNGLTSGTYIYKITVNSNSGESYSAIRKMVLIK